LAANPRGKRWRVSRRFETAPPARSGGAWGGENAVDRIHGPNTVAAMKRNGLKLL